MNAFCKAVGGLYVRMLAVLWLIGTRSFENLFH